MRPIPAVGLASALVQIINLSINTLRKDHAIYPPNESLATPTKINTALQDIINNLYRLTDLIEESELKKLQYQKNEQKKGAKLSEAAQQLLKHSEQAKELVESLRDALIDAQARGFPDDSKCSTARDALVQSAWKKKDVTGTKKKLRTLRKEVDTSLLLALRQYLDQSAETGLPVFAQDDSEVALRHWEKWQNEALDAVHTNDWRSNKKKNVEEFGNIVEKLIVVENEAYFFEEIFRLLWFEEADERLNGIQGPMDGSMKWVFGDERLEEERGLLEWLGNARGENLFWVSGKPGCGKTTLTKHLFRNPQVFDYLEAWSGTSPGITAAFFFWNSGTELQKSPVGLLRSILYESLQDMIHGPLEQDQGIIQCLFPDRWKHFLSYGGGLHDFTFAELRQAFEIMVSDESKHFLLMIDGLDEMNEHPSELVEMIVNATDRTNVKILVSSFASPDIQTAFENRPNLVLDEWTKKDCGAHILHQFSESDALVNLRKKRDSVEEMNVINTLAEKANGVYLWAKLATHFLLQEAKEEDGFSALRSRAGALPPTLELLLPKIVENLSSEDAEQLWKVTTLLENQSHACPRLIPFSHALTTDTKAALAADTRPPKTIETSKQIDDMRNLLTCACKNLFTVFDVSPPEQTESKARPEYLKVTYTHRTIRNFLSSQPDSCRAHLPASFSPTTQWANAHLSSLKSLRPSNYDSETPIWPALASCLESSLLLLSQTSKLPLTYIDAAASTALSHHLRSTYTSDLPSFPTIPLTTFLDLAVFLNIQSFIGVKTKNADRKEARHAIEFSKEMRKRIGAGGERRWLAGSGRELLREEFEKERIEVNGMLEYYAKSVRFGSAKTWVEVPEWE
ncbi:hypothetical protein GQ44DRAFT_698575 [Phaeosphaeriaceae sp. PMI808]|nr:hypothetical protein GQ44DRAFT_698575 [Phaeosphaeriaceae sp. PMI808]